MEMRCKTFCGDGIVCAHKLATLFETHLQLRPEKCNCTHKWIFNDCLCCSNQWSMACVFGIKPEVGQNFEFIWMFHMVCQSCLFTKLRNCVVSDFCRKLCLCIWKNLRGKYYIFTSLFQKKTIIRKAKKKTNEMIFSFKIQIWCCYYLPKSTWDRTNGLQIERSSDVLWFINDLPELTCIQYTDYVWIGKHLKFHSISILWAKSVRIASEPPKHWTCKKKKRLYLTTEFGFQMIVIVNERRMKRKNNTHPIW